MSTRERTGHSPSLNPGISKLWFAYSLSPLKGLVYIIQWPIGILTTYRLQQAPVIYIMKITQSRNTDIGIEINSSSE